MTDTTLSLAARLAANLIVDAINLAKPGARLAGKIGDRLLGGSPFNEREAQRFLTMGGSERLAEAEAEREVWDQGELDDDPSERRLTLTKCNSPTCGCQDDDRYRPRPRISVAPERNTMPNWQAPQSSAPVAPKPTDVAGSAPGSTPAPPLPGVDPGHLNQPVGAGVAEPGTGEAVICGDKTESAGVGHHCACYLPLGHDSWHRCSECTTRWTDGATALRLEIATVCEVLAAHEAFDYAGKVECPHRSDSEVCDDWEAWRQHVAPLIVAALKAPK